MLKLFKKNEFIRSLLLFLLALGLNIDMLLLSDRPAVSVQGVYLQQTEAWLQSNSIVNWLFYSILLFLGAVLLNRLVIINRLSHKVSLLPGMSFILLMSVFPAFTHSSVFTLLAVITIGIITSLLYINVRSALLSNVFNASFFLGVGTLLFAPYIIVAGVILGAINVLRTMKSKDILNMIIGFITPIWIVGLYAFLRDKDLGQAFDVWRSQFGASNLRLPQNQGEWIVLGAVVLLIIFMILYYSQAIKKKGIQTIRKINVLSWIVPFGLLMHLISGVDGMFLLAFLIPAVAFYLSELLYSLKKEFIGESIVWAIALAAFLVPWYILN